MKKQLLAIYDSSTSTLTSETFDIKSEPVHYAQRPNGNSSSNQYPNDGYRNPSFANRGKIIIAITE